MNLAQEAQDLLLHQFAHATKLKGLVRCLVKPLDEVLDAIHALEKGRYITQACGQTLDVIGSIVGQPRSGLSDEDYRAFIKVGIHLNNGLGTPEHVLTIIRILYGKKPHIEISERPPEHVLFVLFEMPAFPLKTFMNIIKQAVPLGTKCLFQGIEPRENSAPKGNTITTARPKSVFKLDVTAFSEDIQFTDFLEDNHHYE